jgi:hypothetical protein
LVRREIATETSYRFDVAGALEGGRLTSKPDVYHSVIVVNQRVKLQ